VRQTKTSEAKKVVRSLVRFTTACESLRDMGDSPFNGFEAMNPVLDFERAERLFDGRGYYHEDVDRVLNYSKKMAAPEGRPFAAR
jgi:hypothetical protein